MNASINKYTTALLLVAAAILTLHAKTDTTRKHLSSKSQIEQIERIGHTDNGVYSDSIILSGYNKTLTDRDETFYVTNRTPFDISRLIVRFRCKRRNAPRRRIRHSLPNTGRDDKTTVSQIVGQTAYSLLLQITQTKAQRHTLPYKIRLVALRCSNHS